MKRLLLLLAFSAVVVDSSPGHKICFPDIPVYSTIKTTFRTSFCQPYTGQLELKECHIPEKNWTIVPGKDVEEIISGTKFITRCTDYLQQGVTITTRTAEETTMKTKKVPGFCSEGMMMWIPNAQWDIGDFVKQCNPDTLQTEIIACRSQDRTFVPRGSNSTIKIDTPNGLIRTEIIKCEAVGNGTEIERIFYEQPKTTSSTSTTSKKPTTKTPKTTTTKPKTTKTIPNTPAETPDAPAPLNPRVTTPKPFDCKNRENKGKEWVENNLVHACKIDEFEMMIYDDSDGYDTIIGCVSYGGNFLEIGENVTESIQPLQAYDSHCLAVEGGAKIVYKGRQDYYPPGSPDPINYPHKEVPKCSWEESAINGGSYLDGELFKLCQIDHRGRKNITVTGCFSIDSFTNLKLGESKVVDGVKYHCRPTKDGQAVLEKVDQRETTTTPPSTTPTEILDPMFKILDCSKDENLGKEWIESDNATGYFVMTCQNHTHLILDKNITRMEPVAVRCIGPDRREIAVGEEIKTYQAIFKCVKDGHRAKINIIPHTSLPKCDNGWPAGHSEVADSVIRVCNPANMEVQAVHCVIPEFNDHQMVLPSFQFLPNGAIYICEKRGEFDAALVRKTLGQICEEGDATLEKYGGGTVAPRVLPAWTEHGYARTCVNTTKNGKVEYHVASVGCILKNGDVLKIGEQKHIDNFNCNCEALGEYSASTKCYPVKVNAPVKCANGVEKGHSKREKGVVKTCTDSLHSGVACEVEGLERKLVLGETARENGTQFSCEKRGEFDAELVVKSFSKLCEEGDETIDAWISEGVLRDCVRDPTTKMQWVHARMCILEDGEMIAIGQNVTYEFDTYICEWTGMETNDGRLRHDTSRTDPGYFTSKNKCKNGKWSGEPWTENKYVRRSCLHKKGSEKPVIVDIGCIIPNGKLVPVGATESWTEESIRHFLHCKEGQKGFGATFGLTTVAPPVYRSCQNGRIEGEEWEDRNVLRTCKEVDDKMVIVAVRCVFGNESLEIGKIRLASEISMVECARVGEDDAAVVIEIAPNPEKFCQNGRKLNEEWTDENSIRRSCRIREKRAKIVALGCVLEDGRLIRAGLRVTWNKTSYVYSSGLWYDCIKRDNEDAVLLTGFEKRYPQDKKSPCGQQHKAGDVWDSGRFIKKCKLADNGAGEKLTAVTIGCITRKGTHMKENEGLDEDDRHIVCDRNADGKMEIHYSFLVKED